MTVSRVRNEKNIQFGHTNLVAELSMNSAMGQIPCSTERIYCLVIIRLHLLAVHTRGTRSSQNPLSVPLTPKTNPLHHKFIPTPTRGRRNRSDTIRLCRPLANFLK